MLILIKNQSAFERDVLAHYAGNITEYLTQGLSAAVALLHNVLPDLQKAGVRMRIVPEGKDFAEVPGLEYIQKLKSDPIHVRGIYSIPTKIIAVRYEQLVCPDENPYYVLIHEFAHAIWFTLLTSLERKQVCAIYAEELKKDRPHESYRMKDVYEFFAECFTYFVTPKLAEIVVYDQPGYAQEVKDVVFIASGDEDKNAEGLRMSNIRMSNWLSARFKDVIDPKLIQLPLHDGTFWDVCPDSALCVIVYRGSMTIDDFDLDKFVIERDVTSSYKR